MEMYLSIDPGSIIGFDENEVYYFQQLLNTYNSHIAANMKKDKYYEGKISVNEVNLGIALPEGLRKLEIGCAWGAKTVDVLAARSMFDGYVDENGESIDLLTQISMDNDLIAEYIKACRDELKYGCTFATLSADDKIKCKIRFHSPQTAAALWDGEKGSISRGFCIVDTAQYNDDETWQPSLTTTLRMLYGSSLGVLTPYGERLKGRIRWAGP